MKEAKMNKLAAATAVVLSTITFITLQLVEAMSKSPMPITAVSRKVLEQIAISGTDEELRLMLVEFPPGYANIAHSHPVASVCYVIEGTALSQYEGEEIKQFSAGQSYQDQANKTHLIFRNASSEAALRFICAAKIKIGVPFLQPK
ncbi:MAG: cupin domain-containing protein [Hyphomicrobium sp.]|jgi:quercetin dioxygenase-like cupin family protein